MARVATGKVMWAVVVNWRLFPRGKQGGTGAGIKQRLRQYFESCSPPPTDFLHKALDTCLWCTPGADGTDHPDAPYLLRLRDIPPLPTFVRGSVALIGDAAHAALPWTGLGISAAALDAQRLANALAAIVPATTGDGSRGDEIAAALRVYDADRRPRGHAVQRAARASDSGQGPTAYVRPTASMQCCDAHHHARVFRAEVLTIVVMLPSDDWTAIAARHPAEACLWSPRCSRPR